MTPDTQIPLRDAGPADAAAIAALHTKSWRSADRRSFTDAYLDGPIEAERLAFWRARQSPAPAGLVTPDLDGSDLPVARVVWPSLSAFVEGVG